jgi:hypothetical protein
MFGASGKIQEVTDVTAGDPLEIRINYIQNKIPVLQSLNKQITSANMCMYVYIYEI